MGRLPRIDYPGAWHHVVNRGASRQAVFLDDDDCLLFLSLLEDVVHRYRIEVHGYALMPNHFHLLVRSLEGLLSLGMAYLGSLFTRRSNRRHGRDGALFRARFRNRMVENDDYLVATLAYLHLNPVEARLVHRPDEDCWTSHRAYMGLDARPSWLRCDEMLALFGDEHVLDGTLRELWQGGQAWPPDLPLDTEHLWNLLGTQEAVGRLESRAAKTCILPTRGPSDILAAVTALTDVSMDDLMRSHHGRGANPARRLAVWALARASTLSNAEIAHLMGMTTNQANLVLSRIRTRRQSAQFNRWKDAWCMEEAEVTSDSV